MRPTLRMVRLKITTLSIALAWRTVGLSFLMTELRDNKRASNRGAAKKAAPRLFLAKRLVRHLWCCGIFIWIWLAFSAYWLQSAVAVFAVNDDWPMLRQRMLETTIGPVVAVIYFAGVIMRWSRSSKHARSLDFMVCPRCEYGLSELVDCTQFEDVTVVVCPECGTRLTRSQLVKHWQGKRKWPWA